MSREPKDSGLRSRRFAIWRCTSPGGQILIGRAGSSFGGTIQDRTGDLGEFLLVPYRERELDVRFTLAGRPHRLRLANPAYKPDLPRWEGQPLPQTRSANGLAVTLKSLELKENKDRLYYGLRWAVKPAWTVALNGRPADKWFRVGCSFDDAGGNRSYYGGMLGEPAWKVNVSVSRSYEYPFPPGEVRWFGRVDPAYVSRLPEGRCELMNVDAEAQASGVYFAGVFAPGEYELKDGNLVSSGPPARRGELNPLKSSFDPETNTARLSVARPLFIRHVRRDVSKRKQEMEVWLSDANEAVYLGGQGLQAGDGFISRQELGKKPFRYGLAKNETVSFEMMVKPPERPQE